MPVTVVPSSQQSAKKKSSVSRKRRQNQNEEIHELASLVPLSSSQLSGLIPSNGGKPQTISVLRLTTTFLKLQSFIKDASSLNDRSSEHASLGRMEEAIDGFLIVLDKDANILYVSETIAGHVGLIQQDVIGQNLADITHPEFSSNITDSLKPSLIVSTSLVDECVVSQHKQFFVKLKPNVSYSTFPSHCLVYVCGNLKVQLSPSKTTSSGQLEFVEPSVIGFIGECRVVESVASILEISIPHSTYTMTRTPDMEKIISIEATVKEILGYDPKVLCADGVSMTDFVHPADQLLMKRRPKVECLIKRGHGVSPLFRFLTSSGEWVWQRVEAKLRYKDGTSIPHFWEAKIRVLGQWGGNLKYIEQKELYQSTKDQSLHDNNETSSPLANTPSSKWHPSHEVKPIIDSLKSTRMPESVLESVLHARSVAMNSFVKQMLAENVTSKSTLQCDRDMTCKMQRTESPQCCSGSTSDSELSPISTTSAESSPTACCTSTTNHSPGAPSATQLSAPDPVGDSGTEQLVHVPDSVCEMVCVSEQPTVSQFSPQLHIQQQSTTSPLSSSPNSVDQPGVQSPLMSISSTDSSPASSTMTATPQQDFIPNPEQFLNSISDYGALLETCPPYNSTITTDFSPPLSGYRAEVDPMLHTASSPDSIPSFSTSVPFQNPSFTPQAPLNDFNPYIPSSFDLSNISICQPSSTQSPPFTDSSISAASISMPTGAPQAVNFDVSNMLINSDASLVQQLVGDVSMMDESSLDALATSLPDTATNMDPMFSHSAFPQTNLMPDSNCTTSLQDSMFSNFTHFNADLASQVLVDSQNSNFHSPISSSTCSSNPTEVQDILQQFM